MKINQPSLADVLDFAGFVAIVGALVIGAPRLAQQETDRMVSECRAKGGSPEWVKPQTINYRSVSKTFRCVGNN